jgi:hypothetical protein
VAVCHTYRTASQSQNLHFVIIHRKRRFRSSTATLLDLHDSDDEICDDALMYNFGSCCCHAH